MTSPTDKGQVIGTNTWALRLSDVATDATDPGNWAWYFNGRIEPEVWTFVPLVDLQTSDDNNKGVMTGQFNWNTTITTVHIKTKADMDLIKRTLRYWNDNNSLLYYQNELSTVDEGYWSNSTWAAADEKIRVRVLRVSWNQQISDVRTATIYLKRYTS